LVKQQYPTQRYCQIIGNIGNYYLEDDDLESALFLFCTEQQLVIPQTIIDSRVKK
jgi:hypothetical protein